MKYEKLIPLALVSLALVACDPTGPTIGTGHYEGTLSNHLDGKSYVRTPVSANIQGDQWHLPNIVLVDSKGRAKFRFRMISFDLNSITVQASPGLPGPVTLLKSQDPQCYSSTTNVKITLCSTQPEITFDITDPRNGTALLSVVLYQYRRPGGLVDESPKAFTLTRAIELAQHKSFSSRIEVEHVIQAKLAMKFAYLNLLPKISAGNLFNSGLASLVPTFPTTIASIGNLPSFLLPNRWFVAGASGDQYRAEQDTFKLIRLNMGATVEGIFYAYYRDRQARQLTQKTFDQATDVRNEVKIREDLGQLPRGSTGNMDSILNQMQQALTVFDQLLIEDRSAISQTLGFFNPQTVQDAIIDVEHNPIEHAPAVDFKTISNAAVSRSFEVDQINFLIRAAYTTRTSQFFAFLDPEADPNLGLGFGLPVQIEISSSKIQELGINREQIQSMISQSALNAVTDYNQALQNFRDANAGVGIQQNLLDIALNSLKVGAKVDFFGLVQVYQNYLASQIQVETARANYRVARARIDRLLLRGFYAKF